MILTHTELLKLIENGVIRNIKSLDQVNGSSVDIRLSNQFLVEEKIERGYARRFVDLRSRDSITTELVQLYFSDDPEVDEDQDYRNFHYDLEPNEFILGSTIETFFLPNNISAQFHLKSSMARAGLGHSLAGHCNPGWNDSTLTLELKNETRYHTLRLKPGMLIGQMVFYKHDEVDLEASYKIRGSFNNAKTVQSND